MVARSAAPGSSVCKRGAKIIFPEQLLAPRRTAKRQRPGRIRPRAEEGEVLTDDPEVEEPGDVGAPLHLQEVEKRLQFSPQKMLF